MPKPVIYIVGMPGSGKTTLAQKAAADLGWEQIDLDKLIETQTGASIAQLFAKSEGTFREAEEQALRGIEVDTPTFISCGGGVVERLSNREFLKNQPVIFLDCPLEVLWSRLKKDANRPLLNEDNLAEKRLKLVELYVRRKDWFKEVASVVLPVGVADLETDADALEAAAAQLLKGDHA